MSEAFRYIRAVGLRQLPFSQKLSVLQPLYVDCANGVGAQKLETLQRQVPSLRLELCNTGDGILNGGCGADAVQKGREGKPCLPLGFESVPLEGR